MDTIDPRTNPIGKGLKALRNHPLRRAAPIEPNAYHRREARPKCGTCARKVRSKHHRCA